MIESYERMYKEKPKYYNSPLEKGYHPELDDYPPLEPDEVSNIGQSWDICKGFSLGRFDVSSAVAGLSTFRSNPCMCHLNHASIGFVGLEHRIEIK
jgi:hypothetical protein